MLRQMGNRQNPAVHRLPSDILIAVASHITDDESLIFATHVCHFWRSVLISSPCLWTRITSMNASIFLERSKSTPVSLDIRENFGLSEEAKESLKGITHRLTTLRTGNDRLLEEIITRPLPILRTLDIISPGWYPPPMTWATTDPRRPSFHAPNLTNFRFHHPVSLSPWAILQIEDCLLDLFRSHPLLEAVSVCYDDALGSVERTTHEVSTKAVSLPRLRSFTHQSLDRTISTGLLNRLSLPPACDVAFMLTNSSTLDEHCDPDPPTLPPYNPDVKVVKITFYPPTQGPGMFRITFINCGDMSITFDRPPPPYRVSHSILAIASFLELFKRSEIARSINVLHFERCRFIPPVSYPFLDLKLGDLKWLQTIIFRQCAMLFFLPTRSLPEAWCPYVDHLEICLPPPITWDATESDVLRVLHTIAAARKKVGNPFKIITLCSQGAEKLPEECGGWVEQLRGCVKVGLVETACRV